MAYRDPESLTCPSCGRVATLVWIIGEGPNTRPSEGPAYTDILDDGGWLVATTATAPKWQGTITCPDCAAQVCP